MEKKVQRNFLWIALLCINENGPPLPKKPIRLAGTWQEYSAKAITQENSTTAVSYTHLKIPLYFLFHILSEFLLFN